MPTLKQFFIALSRVSKSPDTTRLDDKMQIVPKACPGVLEYPMRRLVDTG